jgi:hypothetical protein
LPVQRWRPPQKIQAPVIHSTELFSHAWNIGSRQEVAPMAHIAQVSFERTPVSASFSLPSFAAFETALLLFSACPAKAKAFALSMYERAAWDLDLDQIEHWARIVTQLAQLTLALQATE